MCILFFAFLMTITLAHPVYSADPVFGFGQTFDQQTDLDRPDREKPDKPTTQVPEAHTTLPEQGTQSPQASDYAANRTSDVFGANLFTGAFAHERLTQFNPNYAVAIGDMIHVRFWGAFEFDAQLTVDPKGNIFIPHAGPVRVLGVRNQNLQHVIESAVKKVFRSNVFSYTSLAAAQPVRVFVSGFVNRPGLYHGTSMDSLLHYLDQAGGIDPERGTFLNILVKRGPRVRAKANLYDFLLKGTIPLIQLADGDVIFVPARQKTVKVNGLAENPKRFEFTGDKQTVAQLIKLAKPKATATHVRVIRNTGTIKDVDYYPLKEANRVTLRNGDELEFTADKKPGTITVRVEGEHESAIEYVLPHGARMGDLLPRIEFSERSDAANLQLFRQSVKERQRLMLQTSLQSLENVVLTARSGTNEEARLRREEADLILQWVERAKTIEPHGQVVIARANDINDLLLENGDILKVPAKDGLVLVNGEVLFPNAFAFEKDLGPEDYIQIAGGYTQDADTTRIIVARRDGSFVKVNNNEGFFSIQNHDVTIHQGDEILVLPEIDVKYREIVKDITQVIYQLALGARVVVGLD